MLAILSVLQLLTVKHDNERSSQTHWSMTTAADNVIDNVSLPNVFFFLFSHYDELLLAVCVVAVKRKKTHLVI